MAHPDTKTRLDNILFYGIVLLLALFVFRVFEPFLEPLGWAGVLVVVFYTPSQACSSGNFIAAPRPPISTIGVTLILILPVLGDNFSFRSRRRAGHAQPSDRDRRGTIRLDRPRLGVARGEDSSGAPVGHRFDRAGGRDPSRRIARRASGRDLSQCRRVSLRSLCHIVCALLFFPRCGFDSRRLQERAAVRGVAPQKRFSTKRATLSSRASPRVSSSERCTAWWAASRFAIVGLPAPIFWAIVMAFLSLLPVVGSWPIWLPAAIWLISTGHWGRGAVVLLLCGGAASLTDSFLRPHLIGGRSSLNGLLVFVSVLGGIACFGMLGIVLGPIVVATALSLLSGYSGAHEGAG